MCLQWKDGQCSPYLIDSSGGSPSSKQAVTLRLAEGRGLECEEGQIVAFLDELTYQTVSHALTSAEFHALPLAAPATTCGCAIHPFSRSAVLTHSLTRHLLFGVRCICSSSLLLQASVRVNDLLLFSIDGIDESEEPAAAGGGGGSEGERKQAPSASSVTAAAASSSSVGGGGALSPVEKSAVRFVNLTFLKKASPAVSHHSSSDGSRLGSAASRPSCSLVSQSRAAETDCVRPRSLALHPCRSLIPPAARSTRFAQQDPVSAPRAHGRAAAVR